METTEIAMPKGFEELEQLVQRFYQPGPSQDVTNIQSQLQKWQRSEAGWEVAERLLGSSDPNVRFFGALTITVKLNLDWYVETRRKSALDCFATDDLNREKLNTDNGPSSETVLSGLITTIVSRISRYLNSRGTFHAYQQRSGVSNGLWLLVCSGCQVLVLQIEEGGVQSH